ncbi:oligosaccharide flippase family protein [Ligilactobacillus salivarius]|uniref:oligosaccharide flippase family protein n=1 Tax=Ligilactobacillus salivarius TaxID=1624 RepID=UPI0025A4792A|nr:oligosaccharide flippase family protein [Ligilactobacillus salivarius]MDM8283726.1 oligosaccharide flippase family protein [Ligilactobacillus salivarius]MDO5004783.1 oligosaccharide flippase family protein [Ligilactobacillus salivarius]
MKMNKVTKNTIMLYIMNIAQLILPLVTLPYLTRVLTVDNYGVVNYVKSIMTYMQIIIEFGFILSATKDIVKAGNDKKIIGEITGNVILGKILLSMLSLIVLIIFTIFVPILRNNVAFTMLSFIPIFLSTFLIDFFFRGIEKMEVITIRYIVMKSISTLLTFLFVRGNGDLLMIPILDIIGNVVAILLVWKEVYKLGIKLSFGTIKDIWDSIADSFLYFISSMASTAFGALNTLLVGILLSSKEVAYWSLAMQILGAIQALYTPINNGIYPEMVKERKFSLIIKVIKIFMPVVFIGCLIILLFSKPILFVIGGRKYLEMSYLIKLLIPVIIFSFPAMLFGWPVLGAIDKVKETTTTTVVTTIVQVVGLIVLMLVGEFTLVNIALLRGGTEFILLTSRLYFINKFKFMFK